MPTVRMTTHLVGQNIDVLPGDVFDTDAATAERLVNAGLATYEPTMRESMMKKIKGEQAVQPEATSR